MKQVILAENAFETETWERVEVEDVCEFLAGRFAKFPESARIYHGEVAVDHDVTPGDEAGIARLQALPGPFYVIVYPGDPVTIIVAAVAVVAGIAAALLLAPPPIDATRNTQSPSPNNALSERVNRPRLNGRIPDIFGTVRSTPDLIALPYKIFKEHREVEVAYLCVGRGEYAVADLYDDNTPVDQIEGMQVEVYGPGTSPLSGDPPQMSVGDAITDEVLSVQRSTAVNGQTLFPPNFKKLVGTDNVRADDGAYKFQIRDTSVFSWPELFEAGDTIVVTNGTVDGKALSGTYVVLSTTNDDLVLDNPAAVNAAWSSVTGATSWYGPTIQVSEDLDVGPVYAVIPAGGKLIMNVVAIGGLYKTTSTQQFKQDVQVKFTLTPVDAGGTPTGSPEVFTGTVLGSATTRTLRALTMICDPTATGRFAVVAERVTDTDYDIEGSVVDEVKWRDMYIAAPVASTDFGDVTTVLAVTYGTEAALALKERKLNMEVTRKLYLYDGTGTADLTTTATNDAGQILIAAALDPYIGSRSAAELDFAGILGTTADVAAYFGVGDAAEFNYTFDNVNLSFEESATIIAKTAFCSAYRRGKLIQLSFERTTDDSKLLFNHRNKAPGSETRTVSFGRSSDYDGVAYEYVDPEDDAVVTLYVPQGDDSALRPMKIESLGVRTSNQAHLHAWRAWNKIKYQHTTTEFEATQEAELILPTERVLVADNTRADTWDGEVMEQDVLVLRLSQAFEPGGALDHTIFLQLPDGTVQAIDIASVDGGDPHLITLSEAPSVALSLDENNYARTTYMIQGASPARPSAFLVTDKNPQDNFSVVLRAVNYDARYYANDQDLA